MDHSHNMADAEQRKGTQYVKAMKAFRRNQKQCTQWSSRAKVLTLPFTYGVRGSVLEKE